LGLTINVYATGDTETAATAIETMEEETETSSVENTETANLDYVDATEEETGISSVENTETTSLDYVDVIGELETETDEEEAISAASEEAIVDEAEEDTSESSGSSDSATTDSVTLYTGASSTKTITSSTELSISASGSVYGSDETTVIATYKVASSTVTTYGTYTLAGSAASGVSANYYYVIGDTSSGYLTVDSNGNLTTSTTVNEYSIWKVVSAGSGYYLYNEATGYYLRLAQSSGRYSLSTATTTGSGNNNATAFSYSSNSGFYTSGNNSSTYYYINGSSYSNSSGSSVYLVTPGDASTTYVYTITFTGSSSNTGTGAVTIGNTTYNVTVKTKKTFTATYGNSSTTINQNYGWHIANLTTTTSNNTTSVSAVTAPDSEVSSGYDEDVYFSKDEEGNVSLNVTVYGYDLDENGNIPDESEWTDLTMTLATAASTNGVEYDSDTLYDYDYIVIVPAAGYYVVDLAAACNDTTSAYSGTSRYGSYTNALGQTEYLNVYGEGCKTMGSGGTFKSSYTPTSGTSITLDMVDVLTVHYQSGGSLGQKDPYFLLIEIAEIPTPLYVEYEAGAGDSYIDAAIVDSTAYYWASSKTNTDNETKNSVSYVLGQDDLKDIGYQYTVLNPAVTQYEDSNGEIWYFTGWAVTYYTDATGEYEDDDGYIYLNYNSVDETYSTSMYPTLSGELSLVESDIEYGSNTSIYLFTHVKFVAQWTNEKLSDVDYVVDFGLPVELDVADQCADEKESNYTWSISSIGTYPSYGNAVVSSDSKKIVYTPTSVITDATTMTVNLTGTSTSGTGKIAAVVNVTIYPATTVYYEEGFATYGTTWAVSETDTWSNTTNKGSSIQETHIANDTSEDTSYNNYNYDSAYTDDAAGSEGTAASTSTVADTLTFSFTGTGVDLFANCNSGSGKVTIRVTDSDGSIEKMLYVNMADFGSYAPDGTAYNTPIASISDLTHGSHTVTIYLSNAAESGFNFDGFRVYDTIDESNDESAETVYKADLEDNPSYYELRNYVLNGLEADTNSSTYADDLKYALAQVYASGNVVSEAGGAYVVYSSASGLLMNDTTVADLLDDGPKNELYLDENASVVFKINTNREVQIGLRSVTGESVTYTINDGSTPSTYTTSSSVDMFYDLQAKSNSDATTTTYTITVTSGGILSITDIKVSDSNDESIFGSLTADEVVAALTGETAGTETIADAALTVNLVDYTGSVIAGTELTDNGIEGESTAFSAGDILAAVNETLPNGYALVDEDSITDQTVVYGETGSVNIQIGKVATLTVTYQKYSGLFKKTTVGVVTLTSVQTGSAGKATFSASEIKAAAPGGYKVLAAASASVNYGSTGTRTVTVY